MNKTEHLLICLAEECAEVAQRASKALRFGLAEVQPGQSLTNAERIGLEFRDLLAVAEILEDEFGIYMHQHDKRGIHEKKEKVRQFMAYSEQCGTLQSDDGGAGWAGLDQVQMP